MSVAAAARTRKTRTPHRTKSAAPAAAPPPGPAPRRLSPLGACCLPFFLSLALASFLLLERVRDEPRLPWSFAGAVGVLVAWTIVLFASAQRRAFTLAGL